MIWDPLHRELDQWAEQSRVARLWLRDDDAVSPSPALARLASVTEDIGAVIAVIPAPADDRLAAFVTRQTRWRVAVHGWSHANHAPPDGKKQELGAHRPAAETLAELTRGFTKLSALLGDRLLPMLVPPWNRIDASLLPELRGCGFEAVSVFGPAQAQAPIPMINTHVDLIDWHGGRGGRNPAVLVAEIVRELVRRRHAADEPLGILSHHLVNDETAFGFIGELLSFTGGHSACRWLGVGELGLNGDRQSVARDEGAGE
ncbi:polysaccharide deacetylase family protein [soil metagenome]